MYSNKLTLFFLVVMLISCKKANNTPNDTLTAKQILESTIKAIGGNAFHNSRIAFDVDYLSYDMIRKNNIREFTMSRKVDTVTHKAKYNNGHLQYLINDVEQEVSGMIRRSIEFRVEGFLFEFSVPFSLDQNFIKLTREEDVTINNTEYYCINATFTKIVDNDPEGIFYLYINKKTSLIDFQAVKHSLTGNILRFKKAHNKREINGFIFHDYKMYNIKPANELSELYLLYQKDSLGEAKNLDYTNIKVELY